MSQEGFCTLLVSPDIALPPPSPKELKDGLENKDVKVKIDTLKKLIALQVNGEPQNQLIMTVIKHCVPDTDRNVKKLLMYFWESVDKTDANGKLLPEMILLCSFLRGDLQHPNEYVRGATLRFLCRMNERDILEPVTSSVVSNLSHRVAYVRRNAVLAVHAIYARFPELIPDAPDKMEKFFNDQDDGSARRHALNMLMACCPERATRCITALCDAAGGEGSIPDALLLSVVESSRHLMTQNPHELAQLIPLVVRQGLKSKNPSVLFSVSQTLIAVSSSQTAVKSASSTLIHLLVTHSDTNVKMIVLEKLVEMKARFLDILQGQIMEVLRALSTGGTSEARQGIIDFALDLVNARNVESFVMFMRKELVRSQSEDVGDAAAQQSYRQHIVRAIHRSVMRHLEIATSVVPILLDYVCEPGASSYDVILFVREVMQTQPQIRTEVLERLAAVFQMISSARVLRTVLWLFSVHASTAEQVLLLAQQIKSALEPLPLTFPKSGVVVSDADATPSPVAVTTVREDGTYVTSISLVTKRSELERSDLTGLRSQIVNGDHFLATAVGMTLAKLVASLFHHHVPANAKAAMQHEAVELIKELIRYGTSAGCPSRMDEDSHEHLCLAMTLAQNPKNDVVATLVHDTLEAFDRVRLQQAEDATLQASKARTGGADEGASDSEDWASVETPMQFSQLLGRGNRGGPTVDTIVSDDILGLADGGEKNVDFLKKLHRVTQLSGFSDPIYAEGSVTVHQFDVTIDLTLLNQTRETLTNVTVELATTGELKLCERPQSYMLPSGTAVALKIAVKVSSTEAGSIYGSIVFDAPGRERQSVLLNEVHVDIMDYIRPATCSLADFRGKWIDYEWENAVAASTDLKSLRGYVEFVCKVANMQVLERTLLSDDCGVLSASLYAKSSFGEDALANVCIELTEDGHVCGAVRIRSKTQGIAKSLGDLLQSRQQKGGRTAH